MNQHTLRTFIALPLPSQVQQTLEQWTQQLKQRQKHGVRWVNIANLHLTIKFLGDISPEKVAAIHKVMLKTAAEFSPFNFDLEGVGAFPDLKNPRVIWVGILAPPEMKELHHLLEKNLEPLGFPLEERSFSPHLTLGRIDRHASETEITHLAALLREPRDASLAGVPVDALHLYRSELRPNGPVYTVLHHVPLKPVPNHSPTSWNVKPDGDLL
jgi:2'-5' RNA ligase